MKKRIVKITVIIAIVASLSAAAFGLFYRPCVAGDCCAAKDCGGWKCCPTAPGDCRCFPGKCP